MATGRKRKQIQPLRGDSPGAYAQHSVTHGACLLTTELTGTICAAVRTGAAPYRAAGICGVPRGTWHLWRSHAVAGREPYRTRVALIEAAESEFLAECEARIRAAAQGGEWKADAWLLERRDRNTYSTRLEVTARPAEVDPAELSDADLARIASGGTLGGPDSPPGGDSN